MFDIGWGELVVIGVVALIAIGPKELPSVLRAVGQWTGKIRRMANEFQGQFQEAMREAEMADVKKELDSLTDATTIGNPLADVERDLAKLDSAVTEPPAVAPPASPPPPGLPPVAVAEPSEPVTASAEPTPLPPPPEVEISMPLSEPLPPVTAEDFTPPSEPKKQAGGPS